MAMSTTTRERLEEGVMSCERRGEVCILSNSTLLASCVHAYVRRYLRFVLIKKTRKQTPGRRAGTKIK